MLDTRIPLPTLIDWIDQAILLLHVPDRDDHAVLLSHGIRTATDLEHAYERASDRKGGGESFRRSSPRHGREHRRA